MAPARPATVADRLVALTPALALVMACLLVFRARYLPVSDPDLFWHLRLGEHLRSTWDFVGPEPWSSLATQPLVFHEWLPQLFLDGLFEVGGYEVLATVQALAAVGLLVALYAFARQFAASLPSAVLSIVGFVGASGSIAPRPQLVTFVLTGVFAVAWIRSADDGLPRWWLVPLSWVWTCSHGLWFVGVALGGAAVLAALLDGRLGRREVARLALVPLLSLVAAALTPVGPRLLLTAGGMAAYTPYVTEWSRPSVLMHQTAAALVIAGLSLVVWVVRRPTFTWTGAAFWVVGVACTLMYVRTIALGAVLLTVVAASTLGRLAAGPAPATLPRRREWVTVGVGVLLAATLVPATSSLDVSRPATVPLAMDPALSSLDPGTVVFNDYDIGGWLLWHHPELDPVVDGRADVYDIEHFRAVMESFSARPGWDETVTATGARVALLKGSSPLAGALRDRSGWTVSGDDGTYVLLRASGVTVP